MAKDDGSNYSYGGIVCGIISFFVLGIILAVVAIILGGLGFSKGDKTKGILAVIIGVISLALNVMTISMFPELYLI